MQQGRMRKIASDKTQKGCEGSYRTACLYISMGAATPRKRTELLQCAIFTRLILFHFSHAR